MGGRVAVQETTDHNSGALRVIEWSELVARLKAARDLRILFRRDANGTIEAAGGSFTDAAARYFRERQEYEGVVNFVGLERSKGSSGIVNERSRPEAPGRQARQTRTRDAQQQAMREKIDD